MHRFKLVIGGADAGAGGMSISSGGYGRVVLAVCRLCHGPVHGVPRERAPVRCA